MEGKGSFDGGDVLVVVVHNRGITERLLGLRRAAVASKVPNGKYVWRICLSAGIGGKRKGPFIPRQVPALQVQVRGLKN